MKGLAETGWALCIRGRVSLGRFSDVLGHCDVWLTTLGYNLSVEDQTRTEDEIRKAEEHEAFKRVFLRLLDDPQVQQKLVALLSRRLGQSRSEQGPPN